MSSSTHSKPSSTSIPISLMSMPPSLFGSSVSTLSVSTKPFAPKKKGYQPHKQKRVASKKKKTRPISPRSVSVGSDIGGDFEVAEEVCSPPKFEVSSASVIEQSNLRNTFKFSERDADEPVYKPVSETKSPGSLQIQGETYVSGVKGNNHSNASIGVIDWKEYTEHPEGNDAAEDEDDDDDDGDDDDEEDEDEDETGSDYLEAVIDRGLFKLPCTNGLIDTFRAGVKSYILKKLHGMLNEEPAPDVVLEIADSVDLLRLLGASDPTLDDIGEKMREGVMLYNRGMKKLNEGQGLLRSALSDISLLE